MDKNKLALIIFCISLPLFSLLFSYKTVLFFTDLSNEQHNVFDFIDEKEGLEGYTNSEISHLKDVRNVINFIDYLFYFLLFILTLILTYFRKDKQFSSRLLKYSGISAVLAVLLILIFTLVSFSFSFTIFHEIFFPQGNWVFPSDSKLIQTFPLDFFVEISRNMFILALGIGLLVVVVGRFFMRK